MHIRCKVKTKTIVTNLSQNYFFTLTHAIPEGLLGELRLGRSCLGLLLGLVMQVRRVEVPGTC